MRRKLTVVAVAAALVGAAAWTVEDRVARTDPAPVDVIMEESKAVNDAPETRSAVSPVVRLATRTLRPRAEWDLPRTYNDRVEHWIEYLSGKNRHRTRLWFEREGRYGPMLRERLAERGMPQDLVYLAMIESGLSPKAYSHAHASGMWQFISETGQRYGLEVSPFVDERRDPLAATDAALDYLSDLYERFGSWYLAAAAYNSGENRVERILRQRVAGRKGDDALFWMIDEYLPRETRDYVPLMLAAAHIGKDPGRYGFHEVALEAPLEFEEVRVPGGVALSTIAEAAGLDEAGLRELNPHLREGMTPPGREWDVRVDPGAAAAVVAVADQLEEEQRVRTVVHRIRRGETLSHVARRYGVDIDALRSANPGLSPRRLQVGQRVRVPVGAVASAEATWRTYRVRRGDTLWEIARRNGVSVSQLRSWNGIGSRIYPGQSLRLRG